ncbi:SDR family NAD(P)-dependent oxidoreductase [Bradyrhizobium sp. CER78]|uniref:SDR family NAD(P)-dependent oxidoreductase n=1 Tax=Bradyrhizobium sp. CER78 TaxID=3039162 RepID=UPI0024488D81|nr:SDR family NAD(P)-dependent oxidoreductase [Bradyrhizobium sp. CER78]MDH2386347.1 SDR family NAD(P)-dependent oxidoreductase [Bradyrhizobium sp. CER78]
MSNVAETTVADRPKAVVIGVGPEQGLGAGLSRRFAAEGRHVIVAGRTQSKIDRVRDSIVEAGGSASTVVMDVTQEADVIRLFDVAMQTDENGGSVDLVVYNAGNNQPSDLRTMEADVFESFWRLNCFGGFLVGREAARRLAPLGRGSILFSGATGALRGMPNFAHFASSKAGLRMLAQSMAREFGPLGLHVAHIVIDGGIDGERVHTRFTEHFKQMGARGLLDIDAIADAFWSLHRQHRSAWTHELDLRPFTEPF